MALEKAPCIDVFPNKTPSIEDFSIAMFDCRKVTSKCLVRLSYFMERMQRLKSSKNGFGPNPRDSCQDISMRMLVVTRGRISTPYGSPW